MALSKLKISVLFSFSYFGRFDLNMMHELSCNNRALLNTDVINLGGNIQRSRKIV